MGHARNPIHFVFDGKGNLTLDLFRCQAFGFRIDLNLHRRYIRKGINVQASQRKNAAGNDEHRDDGDEQSFAIEKSN